MKEAEVSGENSVRGRYLNVSDWLEDVSVDLRRICLPQNNEQCREPVKTIIKLQIANNAAKFLSN